jgi:hypothetical protein
MMSGEKSFWFVHQSSLAIVPVVIWYHTGGTGEGNDEFGFVEYICSYWQAIFTCSKILRHGDSGFSSPPKEGVLWMFIALKIHRLGCRNA